jgi:ABC-type transport system involved in cytochrome bd biosynthesis fused ATPase/permease subunit
MTTHQTCEARLITTLIVVVCALGCAAAVVPAVEHAVTLGLLVLGLLALVTVAGRFSCRWLRERREDRADALTAAAAWRAEHAPHLVGVS